LNNTYLQGFVVGQLRVWRPGSSDELGKASRLLGSFIAVKNVKIQDNYPLAALVSRFQSLENQGPMEKYLRQFYKMITIYYISKYNVKV